MSQRPREPSRNRHPTRSLPDPDTLPGLASYLRQRTAGRIGGLAREASLTAILGAPTEAELRVSPAVEQVLGRPPRPFADWATRNAAAFRRARRAGALARGAGGTGMQDA
ncbi:hypothetical protein ACFWJ4_29600 [Kitasatospora sp. NPDC127067]|uniref:hypothetical protein n=1 Tax=Kitasatospora sp. NPDC127067 TaxID=3347126 RepID=UPI003666D8CA